MRIRATAVAPFVLAASAAQAAEVEVAGFAGPFVPTYEQSFRYDPADLIPGIPGSALGQGSEFGFDARGGVAFGGALTVFLTRGLGVEARLDTAGVDVIPVAARYRVIVDLPAPLPDVTNDVELGLGRVDVDRLRPLSLNLKLRTSGGVRLTLSGGVSYLPETTVTIAQPLNIGLPGAGAALQLGSLGLEARAVPADEGSRIGLNAGAGLQIGLGPQVALLAEARFFRFPEHTLVWTRTTSGALSPIEEGLLREIEERLDPVSFNPTFFQATAGLALRF